MSESRKCPHASLMQPPSEEATLPMHVTLSKMTDGELEVA